MEVVIVGVKSMQYTGKDGKPRTGFNYCGLKNYTAYELENSDCEGQDVIREFSSMDFGIHAGDKVEFIYEPGFQGKATLVDVRMIELGDKPPFKEADSKPEDKKTK